MLLVAVSGGIDSMCLSEKVRLEGGPFAIAHCNFSLRGPESDADEAFVRSWAGKYGIPIHVKRFDTNAYAAENGISVEMAARRLRYHWFGQLCREHGYEAVAVAHNANDNAETLLLNLLRGTGLKGITGMKADGYIPDPEFNDIPLRRPLLEMTRADIEAYAAEHGLTWREDSTNALNDYKRNKIRNQVFPVFAEINPSFIQTLNRDMERFAEECTPPGACAIETDAVDKVQNSIVLDYAITEEAWNENKEVKQPAGMLILDRDKAGEFFEGRWETGDWIRPLGAPGRKKMQDWFTDHHIPSDEKPFIPLLKSAKDPHHVLAVMGYCIDHSVRVTKDTRQILRISAKNV